MKCFILKPSHESSAQRILDDFGFTNIHINSLCGVYSMDYDAITLSVKKSIEESPSSMSLFSNENLFVENVNSAKVFLKRLDNDDFYEFFDSIYDRKEDFPNELLWVLNGGFVASLFINKLINIDYRTYGFSSSDEMYYVLAAHISNISKYNDSREVDVLCNESFNAYCYENNIHGDFRLSKYDMGGITSLNPINTSEILPFGFPKHICSLNGYHSVESAFLAGLLGFSLKENIDIPFVNDFENNMVSIKVQGQSFGPYADAGMFSQGSSYYYLSMLPDILPTLPTGHNGNYKVSIKNRNLIYHLVDENANGCENKNEVFSIPVNMIEPLIIALFDKVQRGNGRSSILELEENILHFKKKLYKK
jgi:hypothetical protein